MKRLLFFLGAVSMAMGCSKQSNPVTNFIYTHSDSALIGTMVGFVNLYDSSYNSYSYDIPSGHSGVVISIDGTPFTTTSDSNGKWILKNIPAGTYSITFSKSGYSPAKIVAYKFVGNGTDLIELERLYKIPMLQAELVLRGFQDYYRRTYRDTLYVYPNGDTVTVQWPDSTFEANGKAWFTGSIDGSAYKNAYAYPVMCIYLGKSDRIDPLDPNSYFLKTPAITANRQSNPSTYNDLFDFYFSKDSLQSLGIKSGDRVYCTAVAGGYVSLWLGYTDINTGKFVYTGFSPLRSEVKSFALP